jgi:hypothetical protein
MLISRQGMAWQGMEKAARLQAVGRSHGLFTFDSAFKANDDPHGKPGGTTRVYLMFPIDQLQGAGTRGLSRAGANSS